MKETFQRMWELALPYQDKRDDSGHARIALDNAKKLVGLENGDEDIVIPATILHDIGWSQIPPEKWLLIFDSNVGEAEKVSIRLQHQRAGVKLAGDILSEVGYPKDLTDEILEIISQHDTREGFISKNEGLVRDADKLWRFSKVGFKAGTTRYKFELEFALNRLETILKNAAYFYSESAGQIAAEELELRKKLA